jgi:hypothetical protein
MVFDEDIVVAALSSMKKFLPSDFGAVLQFSSHKNMKTKKTK